MKNFNVSEARVMDRERDAQADAQEDLMTLVSPELKRIKDKLTEIKVQIDQTLPQRCRPHVSQPRQK